MKYNNWNHMVEHTIVFDISFFFFSAIQLNFNFIFILELLHFLRFLTLSLIFVSFLYQITVWIGILEMVADQSHRCFHVFSQLLETRAIFFLIFFFKNKSNSPGQHSFMSHFSQLPPVFLSCFMRLPPGEQHTGAKSQGMFHCSQCKDICQQQDVNFYL